MTGEDFKVLCVAANRDGWDIWSEGPWFVVTDPQKQDRARATDQFTAQMNMIAMWKDAGGVL